MAFFVRFTVGAGAVDTLINLELVTRCIPFNVNKGTTIHFVDGSNVTVNDTFDAVESQCNDASRRS